MQRVLSVSLSHVLRSVAFLLLPFSFIALIAWATAGSASGSTTDPIRGAVWIWLGAHHIPFQLSLPPTGLAGYLTYLPIGGVVLPFIAIRSAFNRAVDRLQGDFHDINAVRIIFASLYMALATALAFLSKSTAVTPQWYLAPVITFLIALIATLTAGYRVNPSRPLRIAARITALILGASLIALSILIFANFSLVKTISISLEPGIFGGASSSLLEYSLSYLMQQLLSLPISLELVCSGCRNNRFSMSYDLGQIPALPLLGVLPTQKHPWALLGVLLFIALGVLLRAGL